MHRALPVVAALLLGVATVFGFAPFGFSELTVLTPAALFLFWRAASSPRVAGWIGCAFGVGLFGAGASWVYIALALFGGMQGVLAGLATVAFCAYLALFPALAGWATARLVPRQSNFRFVAAASCWTLAEWLRSWVLSGFPWLSIGYAHVQTPLGGYAPLGGLFLTSFAVAASAAIVAYVVTCLRSGLARRAALAAVALAALWLAGIGLRAIEWSDPQGAPVGVSLVQGNIPEELKFDDAYRDQTLATYASLVAQAKGRLIVLPESALPMFADEVPVDYVAKLRNVAVERGGDLLLGLFFFEPRQAGEDEDHYFNSVVSVGSATTQRYRKHHLVPFGETIPLKSVFGWFIRSVLHIPLADQTPGPANQAPMRVAGQRVAVNICYEDAFGGELLHALPEATLLVNVTNDAWYGRSIAAEQHEQIAAMRALETSRPMLRATNTGITSIIDHHGGEVGRLPWFTRAILEGSIAGRSGSTPYVRFGDFPPLVLALLLAGAAAFVSRKWRGAPLIQ
jgi:apolipoprotein N-acyltransferase